MNDTQRSEINSMVTRVISRWASEYNIYFKRYSSDQFVAYLNQKILAEIEKSNFEILSQLREKCWLSRPTYTKHWCWRRHRKSYRFG